MVQNSLSRFAHCKLAEYRYLKAQIDSTSQRGYSYELKNCRLLAGCRPSEGVVGFWKDRGGYVMYISPAVCYSGTNFTAAQFFRVGRQGFGCFEDLEEFLRKLTQGEGETVWNTEGDQLTEEDAVILPESEYGPPPDYHALERALSKAVVGQAAAVEAVAFKLYTHIRKKNPLRPLSLIFYGPTGVGKSELGKRVAPVLNQFYGEDTYQFVWTELNTFTQPHSVYRLVGAPPGYVGYEDKPVFEAVMENPNTVFMFDEVEKAHPEVLKIFMSILDEGRCAARKRMTGKSRELQFHHCIFLFTTNADLSGEGDGRPGISSQRSGDEISLANRVFEANERGRRALASRGVLREIAGRFGGYVEFSPLDNRAKVIIIAQQIVALGQEYGLQISYVSPAIIQTILYRAVGEDVLSVRSHASIIEGYLTTFFLKHQETFPDERLRLEGTVEALCLVPAGRRSSQEDGQKDSAPPKVRA